ncbi:hypothetical protein R69658_01642 [Paraburkholderia aspalathi]|uniref:Uncharacterized protein n=1 Tax=Paraburkholderia aspalathi TaxID=1324617 RepID=A0ABM8R1E7_9BURK|nr:hypothetical protein R69658_01642 [Paraburkholderia aspalathi]
MSKPVVRTIIANPLVSHGHTFVQRSMAPACYETVAVHFADVQRGSLV